jgi:hypothetical protein
MTTTLEPLGETDSYSYANGVIAYFIPGHIVIHPSVDQAGITIALHRRSHIIHHALACGLSHDEAQALAAATELAP